MKQDLTDNTNEDPVPSTFRYCRVWQIEQPQVDEQPSNLPQSEIKKHVNWKSQKDLNMCEFSFDGKKYFLAHSRPAWYIFWNDNFKIVDLIVVAESEESALNEFNWLKEFALNQRTQMLLKVKELVPELQEIPEVTVMMGRGTMFNQHRLPATGEDDADIMIFLSIDFTSVDNIKSVIDKLKSILEKHPELNGYYGIYSFRGSSQDVQLIQGRDNAKFKISFDLFPLPFLEANIDRILPSFKPYYIEALKYGEILLDRSNGIFGSLVNKVTNNS